MNKKERNKNWYVANKEKHKESSMNPLLKKAKTVFDGAPVDIGYQCSITGNICNKHKEDCEYRVTCVISTRCTKIVGWFEGDHLVKTNPKPGKVYLKKVFGMKKEKRTGKRGNKLFIKADKPNPDRNEERARRNQRRDEKDKRERGAESAV